MGKIDRSPSEVALELGEWAKRHGFVLANSESLKSHTAKYVELGHCPCVDSRIRCPCEEAVTDIASTGRCECGILIDPARLCMLKDNGMALDQTR
jgi:ferredoxin-thioredoxin reductase catalytic subunit